MKLYLKSLLDRYIYLLPIIMLLITLLSNFVELNYTVVGNLIGYSLFTNIVFWYLFNCTNKKVCWLTKNIPIGLIVINFIDIIGYFVDYEIYTKFFNIFVCTVILILSLIHFIKKNM